MSTVQSPSAEPTLVPEQQHLHAPIPTVVGNLEYRRWRQQLERIDEILRQGGVEEAFVRRSLAHRQEQERWQAAAEQRPAHELTPAEQERLQRESAQALRCNLARTLCGDALRPFARRLADSPLLQWFCRLDRLAEVRIPSKSKLQRYGQWLPEAELRAVVETLLAAAASAPDEQGRQALALKEPLDLKTYFLDSTCVKLPIHFPVDWLLLRDAARTLLKATQLIRRHALKVRMKEPQTFLEAMNKLCIGMAQSRRRPNARRRRKALLRAMKKLSKVIARHAQRHRQELAARWQETDLAAGEVRQILSRIDRILQRLPQAIRQAHERIIGERAVPHEEKLLSLYEDHAAVYVRGKAGAEVEFGSQLLLAENRQGVIGDWELVEGKPEPDTRLLRRSLQRLQEQGQRLQELTGDRGFDSAANRRLLAAGEIYNGLCPRAPAVLEQRLAEPRFVALQRRRGQTEARIAIFKDSFLGSPVLSKGQEHQKSWVGWAVLAHNLWVIARLERQARRRAVARAA